MKSFALLLAVVAVAFSAATHAAYPNQPAAEAFLPLPLSTSQTMTGVPTTGAFPSWLSGSFIRNGPGSYVGNNTMMFQGLSMLHSFKVDGGQVTYRGEFLKSAPYNKAVNSSSSSSSPPPIESNLASEGDFLGKDIEMSLNTLVDVRQMGSADEPIYVATTGFTSVNEIDLDLNTLAAPFKGYDSSDKTILPGVAPSHAQTALSDGTMVHFVSYFFPANYYVYEMSPTTPPSRKVLTHIKANPYMSKLGKRSQPLFMHSMAMAQDRYVVLVEPPVTIGNPNTFKGFDWVDGLPTLFRIIDRVKGKEIKTLQSTVPFFFYHTINCYVNQTASGSETLVLDLIRHPDNALISLLGLDLLLNDPAKIIVHSRKLVAWRWELPLDAPDYAEITGRELSPTNFEFPVINNNYAGRPYKYTYATSIAESTSTWYDTLIKFNVESGLVEQSWQHDGCYPSEVVFVPSPNPAAEDDGLLLSVVVDVQNSASFLLALNATNFEEVARATVPYVVNFGFHGKFFS